VISLDRSITIQNHYEEEFIHSQQRNDLRESNSRRDLEHTTMPRREKELPSPDLVHTAFDRHLGLRLTQSTNLSPVFLLVQDDMLPYLYRDCCYANVNIIKINNV
jgi:hypothetical protein